MSLRPVPARPMRSAITGAPSSPTSPAAISQARPTGAPRDLRSSFGNVDAWIFDLDNTLYPAECNLFRQIDARMSAFIEHLLDVNTAAARRLQKDYYVRYGTTLNGLMHEHGTHPGAFLDFVHDIDASVVAPNPKLREQVRALPGRAFVFTNGTIAHAENVLKHLGLSDIFDDIFDIEAAAYTPKPQRDAYARFIERTGANPSRAAMFEDISHNLAEPHALGMATVLVASAAQWMDDEPRDKRPADMAQLAATGPDAHVHHVTDDLCAFLMSIRQALDVGTHTHQGDLT